MRGKNEGCAADDLFSRICNEPEPRRHDGRTGPVGFARPQSSQQIGAPCTAKNAEYSGKSGEETAAAAAGAIGNAGVGNAARPRYGVGCALRQRRNWNAATIIKIP